MADLLSILLMLTKLSFYQSLPPRSLPSSPYPIFSASASSLSTTPRLSPLTGSGPLPTSCSLVYGALHSSAWHCRKAEISNMHQTHRPMDHGLLPWFFVPSNGMFYLLYFMLILQRLPLCTSIAYVSAILQFWSYGISTKKEVWMTDVPSPQSIHC